MDYPGEETHATGARKHEIGLEVVIEIDRQIPSGEGACLRCTSGKWRPRTRQIESRAGDFATTGAPSPDSKRSRRSNRVLRDRLGLPEAQV